MSPVSLSTSNDDRQRSYTDLIDSVAVMAEADDAAFRRIRVHIDEIRRWFADRTAWRIDLSHEMIRLEKRPAIGSVHQGFSWCESPLDYELLVWLLWYEEVIETHQFVCSELIQELEAQIAEAVAPGHFSWDSYDHRRALRRAVEEMVRLGVLVRLDGSIADMVSGGEDTDALYEFTGVARRLHPLLTDSIEAALAEGRLLELAPADETVPPEQRLYRALILNPVLYAYQDPEAFALLAGRDSRRRIAEDLHEHLGRDLEVTQTYAALLRPPGQGRLGNTFPTTQAAIMHVVLMFCGHLRSLVRDGAVPVDEHDRAVMLRSKFLAELIKVRREYGDNWGKGLSPSRTSIEELTDATLEEMAGWGLVTVGEDPDTLLFPPLAARFRGYYTDDAIAEEDDGDGWSY